MYGLRVCLQPLTTTVEAETKLRQCLDSVGFGLDQLPEHTKRRLAIIGSCAATLGLESASPEALCAAIVELRSRGWEVHIAKVVGLFPCCRVVLTLPAFSAEHGQDMLF